MSSEVGAKTVFKMWDSSIEDQSSALVKEKSQLTSLFQKAVGESLNIATHFSQGQIHDSDFTDLKELATVKNPQDALKLTNSLWKLLDAAGKAKRVKEQAVAFKSDESKLKTKVVEMIAACPIADIVAQVDDQDLFYRIIEKKYSSEPPPNFEETKAILQKIKDQKFKIKSIGEIAALKEPIKSLGQPQFMQIVSMLSELNTGAQKYQNEIDKIVQEKLPKCHSVDEQLDILKLYPRAASNADILKTFILRAECHTIEDWKKAAEYVGSYPGEATSLQNLFLEKFVLSQKDAKFPFEGCVEVCKLCRKSDHLAVKDLPLLLRVHPNVRDCHALENESVKSLLASDTPKTRQDAAVLLSLRDPTILNDLFDEESEFKKFTPQDRLLILAKVVAQTEKIGQFKQGEPLYDLLQNALANAFDDADTAYINEGKELRQALCIRDLALFNQLANDIYINDFINMTDVSSPADLALLKDTGKASVFEFKDAIDGWSGEQIEEYLKELLKHPKTRDLFFVRIDAGSLAKLPKERRARLILDNLDKIPLQKAVDTLNYLKAKDIPQGESILLGVFQCYNLEKIKGATPEENTRAISLIETKIEGDPKLKAFFAKFKSQIDVNPYNGAKALIAFANFAEKYQKLGSPEKDHVANMLSNATGGKILTAILQTRKPDHARFFLASRFIENAALNRNKPLSYASNTGFSESVALEMSTMFSDADPKNLRFWKEDELKTGGDLVYETMEVMELVNQEPLFSLEDKQYLFEFITGAKPEREEGLSKEMKSKLAGAVLTILRTGGAGFLSKAYLETHFQGDHLEMLQEIAGNCLQQVLEGKLEPDVIAPLVRELNLTRDPSIIITIASKLKDLDSEDKERQFTVLVDVLKDFVNGTHQTARFEKSPHLQALSAKLGGASPAKFTVESWRTAALDSTVGKLTQKEDGQASKYKVFITDDLVDISELGTEVVGSCLNFKTGQASDVKTIMGFSADGKTRLLAVKKENAGSEPLQGRLTLKLLWDEEGKTPVIFAEGMRTAVPEDQEIAKEIFPALYNGAVELAKQLNLPLVGWGSGWSDHGGALEGYSHPIASLAPNRNPSEKCDAADTEGVNDGGKGQYVIPPKDLKTLWKPSS